MIEPQTESTFELGAYTVRIGLRRDNPAFPKYLIFYRGQLVGEQFSRPGLSDCQWLHREHGVYATSSKWTIPSHGRTYGRRGRPRKSDSEAQLTEALAA
jgi:hypothetical protein